MTVSLKSTSDSALKEYRLEATGIRATFISYGARLTSLQVPDREGQWREVIVGYANVGEYKQEQKKTYFGCAVGRYANRIRQGQFTVDNVTYQVPCNDHDGANALHGGNKGYDSREWTVVNVSESSITFSLLDAGFEGFPGNVLAHTTYTVSDGKLTTVLTGHALDKATPILLTTHTFFNLGGSAATSVLDDTLYLPSASRYVAVDDISVPTGDITDMSGNPAHPLNYTSPRLVRDSLGARDLSGKGNVGIDNCFIFSAPQPRDAPSVGGDEVVWSSPATGIRMSVRTNQPAIQLYSAIGFDGSLETQLGKAEQYGAIAVEPQGWIDGVNHPNWEQDQIYSSATGPHVNVAEYIFDTVA